MLIVRRHPTLNPRMTTASDVEPMDDPDDDTVFDIISGEGLEDEIYVESDDDGESEEDETDEPVASPNEPIAEGGMVACAAQRATYKVCSA